MVRRKLVIEMLTPLHHELPSGRGIDFSENFHTCDSVGSKVTKLFAEFTPGRNNTLQVKVSDGKGPDHSFTFEAAFIDVRDMHTALRSNRRSERPHVDGIGTLLRAWKRE